MEVSAVVNSNKPKIYVDLNEKVDSNLFLLSKCDEKNDIYGVPVVLHEGLEVAIFTDGYRTEGDKDEWVGDGIVVPNPLHGTSSWGGDVKWCVQSHQRP
jgi:hypothetical protein